MELRELGVRTEGVSSPPINDDVQTLAVELEPLLTHLKLPPGDEARIRWFGSSSHRSSDEPPGPNPTPGSDLLLTGLVVIVDDFNESLDPNAQQMNLLRVPLLKELFQRVEVSITTLLGRLKFKLHPPTMAERVQVTEEHDGEYAVIVDGKTYPVTENQARLFRHLKDANGGIVSGPMIAEAEGLVEFRASRYRDQLKPPLQDLIEVVGNRGFRLVLPSPTEP